MPMLRSIHSPTLLAIFLLAFHAINPSWSISHRLDAADPVHVEPWADDRLTVVDGLRLWLDAARTAPLAPKNEIEQSEPARQSANATDNATETATDQLETPLARWYDASGHQCDAVQDEFTKQPTLMHFDGKAEGAKEESKSTAGWAVRFDGEDDFIHNVRLDRQFVDLTLFVVAAPHSNLGNYRGILAFHRQSARDYESGFTLDLNASASTSLRDINVEGRGFGGARNLMKTNVPFGTLHTFRCVADSKQEEVRLAFDGQSAEARPFKPEALSAEEIVIAARVAGEGPEAQPSNFLDGDIVEILLFDRVLSDDEVHTVEGYLDKKHAALKEALPGAIQHDGAIQRDGAAANAQPLVTVSNPPPIQILVPGFSVYEIPVVLPNLNNVRYRADGKMVALGYGGDIWLLTDTDGDGLEDHADRFFENRGRLRGPIGMAVIPQGHALLVDTQTTLKTSTSPEQAAQGVVLASKGKISAILDRDGDGIAEEEKIIASGWEEISPNVDAIGVAIDKQGAIYFGLGTAAYNNAYLIDQEGRAQYDLASERGTIQRIAPDLSKREIICTGVRFTIGLEFDQRGELFASEQEGATWLPNGNPFDELLHIDLPKGTSKRHYGFPPAHPKHLPNVYDEPSVFDYAPQHQSTCGMAFNLPRTFSLGANQQSEQTQSALFGPSQWRGNLFVTGESRGKLYRTELVTNVDGQYVARNHLLACLSMLTVDCCVSPRGDLIVACHSGGPDWGTGPTGTGKLFAIRYTDPQAPQPITAWAASPQEVRVAFDRPLEPSQLQNLLAQAKITYGPFVSAADRFETLRPGYAVVQAQTNAPRYGLPVFAASVTSDRRVLVLATAPQRSSVSYALTLPGIGRAEALPTDKPGASSENRTETRSEKPIAAPALPQYPQIDLAYSLCGVMANWKADDPALDVWSGVLPSLDLDVSFALADGNAHIEQLKQFVERHDGTLTLSTQLDLKNLLHPAVQPGSQLDHEWPLEPLRLRFSGHALRSATISSSVATSTTSTTADPLSSESVVSKSTAKSSESTTTKSWKRTQSQSSTQTLTQTPDADGLTTIVQELTVQDNLWPSVQLSLRTGSPHFADPKESPLSVSWMRTVEPDQPRPLPLRSYLLPFAEISANLNASAEAVTDMRSLPELANGSWGRGRRVFFSEEAGCAKCHLAHGSGGVIGPDLSNLIHRDYASVLRDVTQPSYAINPDYLASIVLLKDGNVLTGTLRGEGERLLVGDKNGTVHEVLREQIDQLRHSPVSVMPDGITDKLGPERMRDLLTFLLTSPPTMPRDGKAEWRVRRTRAEVAAAVEGSVANPAILRPLNILLVAGPKDHGPGEHDYPAWLHAWRELMRGAPGVTVDTAMDWPSPAQWAAADTVVFFQKGIWNQDRARAVDAHLAAGRGLVLIHWAIEGGEAAPEFAQRIGLASNAATTKYRHGPLDLTFASLGVSTGQQHPIGRNLKAGHFYDESYWRLHGDPSRTTVIASGIEEGETRPLFWTVEKPIASAAALGSPEAAAAGRVFVSVLGHYSATFDDPLFRIVLLRGMAWTARESVDRWNELVTLGVELD